MEPSDPPNLFHGSCDFPTPLTTVPGTTPSPADSKLHNSSSLTESTIDDEKSPTLQDPKGDNHSTLISGPITPGTTSSPVDTDFYSSLPPAKFLLGDEVTCDEEDKMWYTEEEIKNWITISVPAEANRTRADVKKLAVHQMLVLFYLHTKHYGDRCSGPGIQDWMLSMLDYNLRQAYDAVFAHIRNEREPDQDNLYGAFLNLWIRRTIERRLQDAANKTLVETIKAKTREGCTVDLDSYEKMLSTWGIQNNCQAI